MKLNEIMVIREDGLKIFKMDDSTLSKLTKIRGNLYRDDPRLRTVADMPTMQQPQTPEPEMSPEMARREAAAYARHVASQQAAPSPAMQPQPMTFDECVQHDWRTRPDIRAEFVSLASYTAYCRAVRDGRTKVYGRG